MKLVLVPRESEDKALRMNFFRLTTSYLPCFNKVSQLFDLANLRAMLSKGLMAKPPYA